MLTSYALPFRLEMYHEKMEKRGGFTAFMGIPLFLHSPISHDQILRSVRRSVRKRNSINHGFSPTTRIKSLKTPENGQTHA